MESKNHWENVFTTKNACEVSWTQEFPKATMEFIELLQLPKNAAIIDVGGGEGYLAEALLNAGYTNITVLDISKTALEKAKKRLDTKGNLIQWEVADITHFKTSKTFDFWNDRAVFHFLTKPSDVEKYKIAINNSLKSDGHFLLGTFSKKGPTKCSGLEIKQYSENEMKACFSENFKEVKCFTEDHLTPFGTIQNFQYCGFKKQHNL
jgi:2-polyprenyl-3-methyl-5-hydroxy-6-metoxy-1,4-benzoquinol methylase